MFAVEAIRQPAEANGGQILCDGDNGDAGENPEISSYDRQARVG